MTESSGIWESFGWSTRLPAGKRLAAGEPVANSPDVSGPGLATGLTARWHLGEPTLGSLPGGGDVADASGSGNVGTAVNFVEDFDARLRAGPSPLVPVAGSGSLGMNGPQSQITTAVRAAPPAAFSGRGAVTCAQT